MEDRKWVASLAFLLDLLTINQLKEVKIPEKRAEITTEINDILHDIQLILDEHKIGVTAETLRDIIILAQYNAHIWFNESNIRNGIKEGNNLELSHGLNSIRNKAKNRLNDIVGARKEYKLDNVEAFPEWIPSGY